MKPLRCWFGRHSWTNIPNKTGESIVECAICGKPYREPRGPGPGPPETGLQGRGSRPDDGCKLSKAWSRQPAWRGSLVCWSTVAGLLVHGRWSAGPRSQCRRRR